MKTAICQVADTGPLESLVIMLESAGYRCVLPNTELRNDLRALGCDTVVDVDQLVNGMGYDRPRPLMEVGSDKMSEADLFVEIKAHRNAAKIWSRWPGLKILFYKINGGRTRKHNR